jgi:hypothetical protein
MQTRSPENACVAAAVAAWLDEACLQDEVGEVGAAAAAGIVADAIEVRTDLADADIQVGGDLTSVRPGRLG